MGNDVSVISNDSIHYVAAAISGMVEISASQTPHLAVYWFQHGRTIERFLTFSRVERIHAFWYCKLTSISDRCKSRSTIFGWSAFNDKIANKSQRLLFHSRFHFWWFCAVGVSMVVMHEVAVTASKSVLRHALHQLPPSGPQNTGSRWWAIEINIFGKFMLCRWWCGNHQKPQKVWFSLFVYWEVI